MKVTIDRELLGQMRNFTVMHDSGVAGVLRGQIDTILANPIQQGEAVEVAQVVSYLSACADGYDPDAPHPRPPEPLMTVAQHQRILANMRQQCDKLTQALGDVDREHELLHRMKNCEIRRDRGSFGIAVMSDPPALEWQALDKELQQLIDARHAALAESTRA